MAKYRVTKIERKGTDYIVEATNMQLAIRKLKDGRYEKRVEGTYKMVVDYKAKKIW